MYEFRYPDRNTEVVVLKNKKTKRRTKEKFTRSTPDFPPRAFIFLLSFCNQTTVATFAQFLHREGLSLVTHLRANHRAAIRVLCGKDKRALILRDLVPLRQGHTLQISWLRVLKFTLIGSLSDSRKCEKRSFVIRSTSWFGAQPTHTLTRSTISPRTTSLSIFIGEETFTVEDFYRDVRVILWIYNVVWITI